MDHFEQPEGQTLPEAASQQVDPAERLEHFKDLVRGRLSREELVASIREVREKDLMNFSFADSDLREALGIRYALLTPQERQNAVDLANQVIRDFKVLAEEVLMEIERDPRLLQLIEKGILPLVRALGYVTGDAELLQAAPETEPLTDADRRTLESKINEWGVRFEEVAKRMETSIMNDPKYASLIGKFERLSGKKADISSLLSGRNADPKQSVETDRTSGRSVDGAPKESGSIELSDAQAAIREYEAGRSEPLAEDVLYAKLRMAGVDIDASKKAGALGEPVDAPRLVALQGSPVQVFLNRIIGLVEVAALSFKRKKLKDIPSNDATSK